MKGAMLIACKADVFAPESTRAFIVGISNSGKEHHSSLPRITFLAAYYLFLLSQIIKSNINICFIKYAEYMNKPATL
jgi:hypothetical protein